MKKTYNILVTGCGGDIGQSIGKILKSELLFSKVIGVDMNSEHPGKFIFDACHQVPRCDDNFYFEILKSIVDKERIDIILPIAEPELRYFTKQQIDEVLLGKPLIVANIKAREIGFDKLLTAKFLKNSGLPFPQTHILSEMRTPDFPQLVKDRNGSGSKALFILNDKIDFEYYKTKHPGFIVQELIGTPEAEYTCGVFRNNKNEIRTLIYKRKLAGGFSGYGIVEENSIIRKLLSEIAVGLQLQGSINVQLRLRNNEPVVFEINPRFSSTVLFRHMMGFKDVIWSIEDKLKFPISPYKEVPPGKKFYKGFTEYID